MPTPCYLFKIRCVDLYVIFPLFWNLILYKDRLNRTRRFTYSSIDAFFRINVELINLFKCISCIGRMRVNAIYRTHVNACAVFYVNARFANYVRHFFSFLCILLSKFSNAESQTLGSCQLGSFCFKVSEVQYSHQQNANGLQDFVHHLNTNSSLAHSGSLP